MSIQAFQAQFSANTPFQFIDPQTGVLTKTGQYLFLQLWNRTGKGTGIVPIVGNNLVASGASLGGALQLVNDWNLVGTVGAGTGVAILPLKPGNDIQVFNGGLNALNIYPPTSADSIDSLGPGNPYSLIPQKLRIFECWVDSPSQFYSYGN